MEGAEKGLKKERGWTGGNAGTDREDAGLDLGGCGDGSGDAGGSGGPGVPWGSGGTAAARGLSSGRAGPADRWV